MKNWLRKLWRVYYDFPMNWQPWGWEHTDMTRIYWSGEAIPVKEQGNPS